MISKPTASEITVCQVVHSLNIGGAEVLAIRLASQNQGPRFRFLFACLDDLGDLAPQVQAEGVDVVDLQRRPGFDWACARKLANLLAKKKVDVVHAHQYTPFFYAACSRLLRKRPPILFTEHGRSFPDYPRPKRRVFNRLMLASGDRVVGVGESVRQALIANEGLPEKRVNVIYNGVEERDFRIAPERRPALREAVRAELGIPMSDFVVIQVARLDALKDHATAIRAMARLATAASQVRLLLVGDGPEKESIERTVREDGLQDRVILAGLRKDVPRLLAAADCFLLTSISEGIPVTLIEAMYAEIPIVCTEVGGAPEVIVDHASGLLCPARDDAAIAAAITRIQQDAQLGRQLVARGLHRAETLFSERAMHDSYRTLYEEMTHGD